MDKHGLHKGSLSISELKPCRPASLDHLSLDHLSSDQFQRLVNFENCTTYTYTHTTYPIMQTVSANSTCTLYINVDIINHYQSNMYMYCTVYKIHYKSDHTLVLLVLVQLNYYDSKRTRVNE